jgi:hypothetical protein
MLYKYGGVYMDINNIIASPDLFKYKRAFALQQQCHNDLFSHGHAVANGFMAFPKGDIFVKYIMERFLAEYNRHTYAENGPGLHTRLMRRCFEFQEPLGNSELGESCRSIMILNFELMYPIWDHRDVLFRPMNDSKAASRMMNIKYGYKSYALKPQVHYFKGDKPNKDSFFVALLQQYCPITRNGVAKRLILDEEYPIPGFN